MRCGRVLSHSTVDVDLLVAQLLEGEPVAELGGVVNLYNREEFGLAI